jgi:protein SCO1
MSGRVILAAMVLVLPSAWAVGCVPGTDATASKAPMSSEPSLFELSVPMTDQGGRTRRMADFRGRPFVATMIYTRCTTVCPRLTADLKRLEAALDPYDRERTSFLLFSLDPEHDTPATLTAFAAAQQLDLARWSLLATTADDMRTIAAVLDVRFRPDDDDEIAHSAVIAVVDANGVIRHRQVGMVDDTAPLVRAVRAVTP